MEKEANPAKEERCLLVPMGTETPGADGDAPCLKSLHLGIRQLYLLLFL